MTHSANMAGQYGGTLRQTVAVLDELMSRADEFEPAGSPPALYREKPRQDAAENGGFLTRP